MSELQRLGEWLVAEDCTHAVMESTGSYWTPVFNLLEPHVRVIHVRVILANAADVQNRRGHKLNRDIQLRMEDPALAEAFHLLRSIPGIKEESAASILAEIGADMEQFPGRGSTQFLGWAGPSQNTGTASS